MITIKEMEIYAEPEPGTKSRETRKDEWTIKQYQVPIENKQIPTITGSVLSREPTACKIVCTYTHSACKSEEYLNKYKFCPNCGRKMVEAQESEKINCKSTKCENCINHNYCDYESQEEGDKK